MHPRIWKRGQDLLQVEQRWRVVRRYAGQIDQKQAGRRLAENGRWIGVLRRAALGTPESLNRNAEHLAVQIDELGGVGTSAVQTPNSGCSIILQDCSGHPFTKQSGLPYPGRPDKHMRSRRLVIQRLTFAAA